ncbi:hypothetical protein, partial [Litchfieldella anticariensis]
CQHSRRFRLAAASGQRLPHRQPTVDMAPMSRGIRLVPPQELREIESQSYYRVRPEDRPRHPLRMDEECLRYTSQTKRNFFFGVIRLTGMIGLGMTVFAGVGMLILLLLMSLGDNRVGPEHYLVLGKIILITSLVCLCLWGGQA